MPIIPPDALRALVMGAVASVFGLAGMLLATLAYGWFGRIVRWRPRPPTSRVTAMEAAALSAIIDCLLGGGLFIMAHGEWPATVLPWFLALPYATLLAYSTTTLARRGR